MMWLLVLALATLPNPTLTPGAVNPAVTKAIACNTVWGKDRRAVTESMKREACREYGVKACDGKHVEIDHRIPREIGGADDIKNLWAQPRAGTWNAHRKDVLENRIAKAMCASGSTMTIGEAQAVFTASDWTVAYRKWVTP